MPQKSHVFLDAEGTLWEPKPGFDFLDFWAEPAPVRAALVFQLTANLTRTLKSMRQRGVTIVVVSKHDPEVLPVILDHFRLSPYLADVLVNGDKGRRIEAWLRERGIAKERALMVGDRHDLDIAPLQRVGIDAVLLDRPYNRDSAAPRLHGIGDLEGLIRMKVA